MVKDEDPSVIACDSCGVWYHGCPCGGLSQDDVTVMGRIRGCRWICSVCHNDDFFTSKTKLKSLIAMKEFKISGISIQNSLDEIKTKLEPTHKTPNAPPSGEPTCREILLSCLVEDKGAFHSSFEADDFKLKEVFQRIGEPMLSIETTRQLGRPQRDLKRPRPLLVCFTSESDPGKSLSRAYKLKSYPVPLFFSKSLNKEDQATRRKLLEKRYPKINNENVPRGKLRSKGFKLVRNGIGANLQK